MAVSATVKSLMAELAVNDRRIVGAGDGDGEIVVVERRCRSCRCPSSTVMS